MPHKGTLLRCPPAYATKKPIDKIAQVKTHIINILSDIPTPFRLVSWFVSGLF